jgi:hypothetical protein
MWISARDQLPGLNRDCLVWPGIGGPRVARLQLYMEVSGAYITGWVGDAGWRCVLNEGHFWIRLPELPQL